MASENWPDHWQFVGGMAQRNHTCKIMWLESARANETGDRKLSWALLICGGGRVPAMGDI